MSAYEVGPNTRLTPHTDGSDQFTLYELDACETCGGPVVAANSLHVDGESARALIDMGLPVLETLPADGYHDDETGMEVCDNCALARWTPQDVMDAAEEGWGLYDASGRFEIERDDEARVFESDLHAQLHVISMAIRSDDRGGLHYRALAHWKTRDPKTYAEAILWIVEELPSAEPVSAPPIRGGSVHFSDDAGESLVSAIMGLVCRVTMPGREPFDGKVVGEVEGVDEWTVLVRVHDEERCEPTGEMVEVEVYKAEFLMY